MSWYIAMPEIKPIRRAVERPRRRITLRLLTGVTIGVVLATRLYVVPYMKQMYGMSRDDIARQMVKDYGDAIPRWQADHPGRACPSTILELNAYTPFRDDKDPWEGEIQLLCTPKGMAVYSYGEDGRFGTADDLWSQATY
jgi:hypothetical protein